MIGGQQVTWNIHHTGQGYYCPKWEQDMLRQRVLTPKNGYVLDEECRFYAFIYHILMHNKTITQDHYTKAESLLQSLVRSGIVQIPKSEEETFIGVFDVYFNLLNDYMKRKGYHFCPSQRSWFHRPVQNQSIANMPQIADRLAVRFGLNRVKPILVALAKEKSECGSCRNDKPEDRPTFYQAWRQDRKIFIKYGNRQCKGNFKLSFRTEFNFCNQLYAINENNFPEALFYSEEPLYHCIAHDFLTGKTLKSKIKDADFSPSEKESIIIQLKNIAQSLADTGIGHGDLHLDNLFVTKSGELKLIDFGFAMGGKHPEECPAFKRSVLWSSRSACVRCAEGDIPRLLFFLESVGHQENYQNTYHEVETFLKNLLGTRIVKCKHHRFVFLWKILYDAKRRIKVMVRNGIRRILCFR